MTLPSDVATKLGLTPDHLADVIATTIRSVWITGTALGSGMLVSAVANGAKTPADFLTYAKTNWLIWFVANIVAPAIRGAKVAATAPVPPALPDPLKVPPSVVR
jgi:hypothetical protein